MKKELPSGWKELQIKDVLNYERPDLYIVKNNIYKDKGVAVLTANKSFILGYTDEKDNIYNDIPVILFDDFTADKKYVNFPFKVKSSAIKILKSKEGYNLKFIYEVLNIISFNCKVHKRYYISEYQNLNILVPPLDEQKRIADILSTFDDLIENLTKLIEKKELYKKGVMQRVLSGEVRFNGFTDEWETVSISELVDKNIIYIEKGKAISKNKIIEGDIPVIAGGKTPAYYHNEYTHDFPCITISASGAYSGYVWFHNYKIWASDCNVLYTENKKYNTKFLFYYLNYIQKLIYYMQTGGAQPHIYAKNIITLTIPNISLEEQNKIAELLTLIDKDIEILKRLLQLRKLQKKGVMQKLLTGEVRV